MRAQPAPHTAAQSPFPLHSYLPPADASNVVGTSAGFLGSALLYHWGGGIAAVARYGAALEAAELAALAAFLALAAARPDSSLSAHLAPRAAVACSGGSAANGSCPAPLARSPSLHALNSPSDPGAAVTAAPAGEGEALELMRLASVMQMELNLSPAASAAVKGEDSAAAAARDNGLPPPPLAWIRWARAAGGRAAGAVEGVPSLLRCSPRTPDPLLSPPPTSSRASYFVVATFAVQALCIGCVLSTAPLLFYDTFGLELSWVGLLFGAGEAVGSLALVALVPASRQRRWRTIFRVRLRAARQLAMQPSNALGSRSVLRARAASGASPAAACKRCLM